MQTKLFPSFDTFLYLLFMSRNLFLNITKPQDSLHGSEQNQFSSAPLERMTLLISLPEAEISYCENLKDEWEYQRFQPSRKKKWNISFGDFLRWNLN